MIINGLTYWTNITNEELLSKCVLFFTNGCPNYVISYETPEEKQITKTNVKGFDAIYLRDINLNYIFCESKLKDNQGEQMIKKGYDLIELL